MTRFAKNVRRWECVINRYENNDRIYVISDSDTDKHFINGRRVAENEVTDISDKIKTVKRTKKRGAKCSAFQLVDKPLYKHLNL